MIKTAGIVIITFAISTISISSVEAKSFIIFVSALVIASALIVVFIVIIGFETIVAIVILVAARAIVVVVIAHSIVTNGNVEAFLLLL